MHWPKAEEVWIEVRLDVSIPVTDADKEIPGHATWRKGSKYWGNVPKDDTECKADQLSEILNGKEGHEEHPDQYLRVDSKLTKFKWNELLTITYNTVTPGRLQRKMLEKRSHLTAQGKQT